MACLLDSKDVLCFWNGRNFKIKYVFDADVLRH